MSPVDKKKKMPQQTPPPTNETPTHQYPPSPTITATTATTATTSTTSLPESLSVNGATVVGVTPLPLQSSQSHAVSIVRASTINSNAAVPNGTQYNNFLTIKMCSFPQHY
jgi:hypothetical protein